ncbi:AMP-dependent synthetase/ligase [Solitalea koreensis]|uniref:Long-chain acyl-CoA synthetase n=1 Tax=Solitalea koreensis TaxID=543615 RepID=A0A521DQ43_9SPHI|nr:long-chain fatty acid--CoA ligase [Solitalea koreensis]SMO73748.1 long-chain acyl-CoA synthetase [Solitalea koreensis]
MIQLSERTTIPQLLRNVVQHIKSPDSPFLMEKKNGIYKPISFQQTLANADAFSAWFFANGIIKGDRLGLIIENCPEYIYYDQGLQQIGAINVSIYPTLSETEIEHIINDAGIKSILVGNPFLLRKVLKIADHCPSLQFIIPIFNDHHKISAHYSGSKKILTFNDIQKEGAMLLPSFQDKINEAREMVQPEDVASLIYTSGTTGTPKGAMLTHHNFVNNVKACLEQIPVINPDDVFLSFLPLSHVFERTATYHVCCAVGSTMAFSQSLELLGKNMIEVQPTVMSVVPRLLERICEKAMKSGTNAGGFKSKIFLWAFEIGKKARFQREAGKSLGPLLSAQALIADKLVFSKIKEKTGGKLKFLLSGGAALPIAVGEFFGNIGIKILEGYGLTETSPVMSVTEYHRQVIGTVGRIIPGITVAIQNTDTKKIITEQTHESFDPNFESEEGEIIVRGHCVMKGYWNNPKETEIVIDENGWFHTGDVGKFSNGNLKITDRIKNILINSYGKNIYPTLIENTYLKSPKIEQIFLIGDKRDYITAIIVPSHDELRDNFDLDEDFFNEPDHFIEEERIVKWIKDDVRQLSNELAKFERIKNFCIKRHPFTIESGEITPTLKTKRRVIEAKYAEEIDELYEEMVEAE